MQRSLLSIGLALALAALLPDVAGAQTTPALEGEIAAQAAVLASERRAYPELFKAAYQRYPAIPRGQLEALAWVQTRWSTPRYDAADNHLDLPRAYGVMGLYRGEGFADQVGRAAQLLRVPAQAVIDDPRLNILGAAALLDAARASAGRGANESAALAAYAGFASTKESALQAFARESFAYDVLLTIDRGVDDNGVRVAERAIAWEREFSPEALVRQKAPFVRLDAARDRVETSDYFVDAQTETLQPHVPVTPESTDYGPALWVASPYHSTRSANASAVTIHTMQGSYAGSISWFQNNPNSVSAHYLIRSSDGQVTQMVRENRAAHHVRSHNGYTLGIEHEGFINNASWYTTAMYNASAALTRHFCSAWSISCASAYNGNSSSGVVVLPDSTRIKGHQHYSGNDHTDPGINWDWRRYYTLLNPGSGGTTRVFDTFEANEGHFTNSPTYSGSTVGVGSGSASERICTTARNGSCSEQIKLVDDTSTTAAWSVRFLSGGGTPGSNTSFSRDGQIGFWAYTGATGVTVAVGIDDSDGTEQSTYRTLPANTWTYVEWSLTDANQWNAWVGGNGAITGANVTLDAIWIDHANTAYTIYVYVDDVQWQSN
jgi:N-acetyl-anhydromuramyl-L-alanine amidase AmpD